MAYAILSEAFLAIPRQLYASAQAAQAAQGGTAPDATPSSSGFFHFFTALRRFRDATNGAQRMPALSASAPPLLALLDSVDGGAADAQQLDAMLGHFKAQLTKPPAARDYAAAMARIEADSALLGSLSVGSTSNGSASESLVNISNRWPASLLRLRDPFNSDSSVVETLAAKHATISAMLTLLVRVLTLDQQLLHARATPAAVHGVFTARKRRDPHRIGGDNGAGANSSDDDSDSEQAENAKRDENDIGSGSDDDE
jgi:hypothetical protein